MSRQLLRLWKNVPLPFLNQGSTLSIRASKHVNLSVIVLPQWRDDGNLNFQQTVPPPGEPFDEADLRVRTTTKATTTTSGENVLRSETSMGRRAALAEVAIDLKTTRPPSNNDDDDDDDGGDADVDDASYRDGDGGVDAFGFANVREGCEFHPLPEDILLDDDDDDDELSRRSDVVLTAKVPEKCNLECVLERGSVEIQNKMEGDAVISVARSGNVSVSKIRGHKVSVSVANGTVHASKLIEAQDVDLRVTETGRIRARMINGGNVRVRIVENARGGGDDDDGRRLDDDDAGALVDVGSLYTSRAGDGASIEVSPAPDDDVGVAAPRYVRVKSHHGHLNVRSASPRPRRRRPPDDDDDDDSGDRVPLVEVGGVNGSCDVSVVAAPEDDDDDDDDDASLAVRLHVDSLAPNSVSVVTCERGDVDATLDRKIEADLRLLSSPSARTFDVDELLDDDEDAVREALTRHDADVERERRPPRSSDVEPTEERIRVSTSAFEESDDDRRPFRRVRYRAGEVRNRSREPDSRFDVQTKGEENTNRRGKIHVENAAAQALRGFSGFDRAGDKENRGSNVDDVEEGMSAEDRPLLGVVTNGSVSVETVSWFGAIARRYGMEETARDLGRQARKIAKEK